MSNKDDSSESYGSLHSLIKRNRHVYFAHNYELIKTTKRSYIDEMKLFLILDSWWDTMKLHCTSRGTSVHFVQRNKSNGQSSYIIGYEIYDGK